MCAHIREDERGGCESASSRARAKRGRRRRPTDDGFFFFKRSHSFRGGKEKKGLTPKKRGEKKGGEGLTIRTRRARRRARQFRDALWLVCVRNHPSREFQLYKKRGAKEQLRRARSESGPQ